ncbi:MAG: hypothetical protein IPM06_21070 [Rhizobiales bacterium]|nr:hypothetical protein [Hyphomicrobiales bacterium]
MTAAPTRNSRASDERILRWLRLRQRHYSLNEISRLDGVNVGVVTLSTRAVRDADLAESGEPSAQVRLLYDWRTAG